MASCSGNGSRGHHQFTLNVWESYVSDGANNYSTVSWSLVLSPIQNGWDWNYSATVPVSWRVNIAGVEYTGNIMQYDGRSTITVGGNSLNIWHESDGSKSISFSFEVWDNVSANYLPGYASGSGSLPLTNIPRYASITRFDLSSGLENIRVDWSADVACDWISYKLNGGNWIDAGGTTFYINNLAPNTQYSVKIKVRRKDSGLWTESSTKYVTTKDIARITSAPNINFGDTARITKTNPSSTLNHVRVETLNPFQTVATRTQTSDDMTITFTDEEWDKMYKCLGNNNSLTIRYVVDTKGNNTYYDWVDRTLTLKGNQKTIKNKQNSSWKRAKLWIKVAGTWKRAVIWLKVNNTWRRGI